MSTSEWTDRNQRQADAAAQYEHIMTTPAPPAIGAYIDAGVIGFVFGEMWRRGVLTPRDRRWVTLACVGVAGASGLAGVAGAAGAVGAAGSGNQRPKRGRPPSRTTGRVRRATRS